MAQEEETTTKDSSIRGVTLRVAIFFGLTTFTLCIAIFYIESILDETQIMLEQKDSLIHVLRKDLANQELMIKENENQIRVLRDQVTSHSEEEMAEEEN